MNVKTLLIWSVCLVVALSTMTLTARSQAYSRLTVISLPNVPPPTGSFSYDIGWVDSSAHRYYVADRTNKGIDVVDTASNTYLTTLAAGKFQGFTGNPDTSGPDGVLLVPEDHQLWVGDAHSLVKVVDAASGEVMATISTGGENRADELAYDPQDHLILIANDADDPPFLTFISTTTRTVVGKIAYPQATNGLEQPVWNPANDMFYQAVPSTKANPGGEIDRIDPKTMKLAAIYAVKDCMPAGLTLGPQQHLLLGCSGDAIAEGAHAQTLVMDATDGFIVATITQVGGSDQVWYNPGDNRYYLASRSMTSTGMKGGTATPVLGVIDAATNQWIANIPTGPNAHSVAADSGNNRVFVPVPQGIAVFAR